MSAQEKFMALCAYGVTMALSVQLMQKYQDEDDIPLSEFDPTEYQSAQQA